jgi:hypothetical protein
MIGQEATKEMAEQQRCRAPLSEQVGITSYVVSKCSMMAGRSLRTQGMDRWQPAGPGAVLTLCNRKTVAEEA